MATGRILPKSSSIFARWLCTAAKPSETAKKRSHLFQKIVRLTPSSKSAIVEFLDNWVCAGNVVRRSELISLIAYYRNRNKYHLASQLFDWMEKSKVAMQNSDQAVCIGILHKTKGLASAEKYFDGLQDSDKTQKTFGAIINCYCNAKVCDKALETFEKMKELNYAVTVNYNSMLALYYKMDQPEKVVSLVQEMEAKHIALDIYTYNLLLNTYAVLENFDAVEEVLEKMKGNNVECCLFTCGNLATIYVNRGLFEKANHMLETMEKMENPLEKFGFGALRTRLKLYSDMNNLSGVKRAWESFKSTYQTPNNTSHLFMLVALSKLGDQETLEDIFKEWETGCSSYDFRLPNVLLKFYLRRDMIEEAATLFEKLVNKGMNPNLSTYSLLADLCIKKGQIDSALKHLETGFDQAKKKKKGFCISEVTINLFLNYLEERCDEDRAEKFIESMRKIDGLESVCDSLLLKIKSSNRAIDS
ncbi:pentatricopeptide repeat-containing protein At1g02370, mitochondrial-like [Henckelia pumila]|uniref:pentatricopeptide repeat-containing protein At1g02370, mitochondrial-like n=1 Tax=Henckelia pumila TaxID=405737 RepID=UPI003C6DD644